jgi:hypothetical protein
MSSPRSTGTEDLGNFLDTRGLIMVTPPRRTSRSRSPPHLRRSAARRRSRSRSPSHVRSSVSTGMLPPVRSQVAVPLFPANLRGRVVEIDWGVPPPRRLPYGHPVESPASVPKTPKHIRTLLTELRKLENELPGLGSGLLGMEKRKNKITKFINEMAYHGVSKDEWNGLFIEIEKMLEKLRRNNILTTKQFQNLKMFVNDFNFHSFL